VPELPLIAEWQRVTHGLLAGLDRELSELRLSAAEINALACFTQPSRTVRELVHATGQRPSTLTGVLDRLERRRLIERRPHPTDRRSIAVHLTADGRVAADEVAAAFAAVEAGLPADDIRRVLAALS
jgi:MarR family transcriptional regulator, organic hydroperoxide resistance regulator